jgi:hypothetical protein
MLHASCCFCSVAEPAYFTGAQTGLCLRQVAVAPAAAAAAAVLVAA